MTRGELASLVRSAGYHEDSGTFVRLVVERRISMAKARRIYEEGRAARAAGVRCICRECTHNAG